MRTNNRVHDHLHGLCSGTVIYIDRLTILMADHSACHQIVAMHTNIQKLDAHTQGGHGGNTGTVPETGLKTATDRSMGNHGKITLCAKENKGCDFQLNRMNKWVGMDKNRLPTGKPWPVKHCQALRVHPSVRLSVCSHFKGGV